MGAVDIDIYEDELTLDNVIGRLKSHERKMIYSKHYSNEIDFLSKNFWKAVEEKKSEMMTVSKYSLENILKSNKLRISNEDELVSFINELIENNKEKDENNFTSLYEYVLFENIESSTMKSFIDVFDFNDMNSIIWNSLSSRLVKEVKKCDKEKNERYKIEQTKLNDDTKSNKRSNKSEHIEIPYSNKEFEGIISFLKKSSNIKDEVNITSSSNNNEKGFNLHTFINYENTSKWFCTRNEQNSWICFEFINHQIIPTHYSIKSHNNGGKGDFDPKSWVIEGSTNSKDWINLSEEQNTEILDGRNIAHTFPIRNQSQQKIKFIRIRQTGQNSKNNYHLCFSAFEVYGQLI